MLNHAKKLKRIRIRLKPGFILIFFVLIISFIGRGLLGISEKILQHITPFNEEITHSATREAFNFAFAIKDLNNKKISFERFKGKVVFINLWATWCGPCRAEMPGIEALYQKVSNDAIQFVMLSLDEDADLQKVRNFIDKNNYSFPVFMPSGSLPPQLRVNSIPVTIIVDKQGNIVKRRTGMTNYNTEHYVKLLKELAVR